MNPSGQRISSASVNTSNGRKRPYTIVYDGTCGVCLRLMALLHKWDSRGDLEMLPSQTAGLDLRFPWIPRRAYMDAMQLVGPGDQTWQGAAAIEQLLNILPKGRLVGWLFAIPVVRVLADRFYKWFARNRYHLGCGAHCPTRPLG